MDDFPGLLARDFGYKPQGKSAPMAPPRSSSGSAQTRPAAYNKSGPVFDDHDNLLFNDVFGGPRESRGGNFDYESIFKDKNAKTTSLPSYDKPVYDDDIFNGLPGVKNASSTSHSLSKSPFDDLKSASFGGKSDDTAFDDLLGNLGKKETGARKESDSPVFDDLLGGFGSTALHRSTLESNQSQRPSTSAKTTSSVLDNPFVVLESTSTPPASSTGLFTDPLDEISRHSSSASSRVNNSSANRGVFEDIDAFDSLGKSVPPMSPEVNKKGKERSPPRSGPSVAGSYARASGEPVDKYPVENAEDFLQKKRPVDDFQESHETLFDMSTAATDFRGPGRQTFSPPPYENASPNETIFSPRFEDVAESSDDVWLTVSEIPLFTQPTSAPPPSRPPPPRPPRILKSERGAFSSNNSRKKVNEYSFANSTHYSQSPRSAQARSSTQSPLDELEDAMGWTQNNVNNNADFFPGGDAETNSSAAAASAAAMKEVMEKAEAKIRLMREREHLKSARSRDSGQVDRDMQDAQQREARERQERLDRERQQGEREEEERELRRLEKESEREREREREEKEREQRRLERERERAREVERERGRHAVERATREARERAATEARLKAERAAVEKAAAEARERAERVAVQRAQAEARERAAAEAKERAERAATEARERANAEAREKVEARARAERATVERAAAEARERAAAIARANQQKNNENNWESFFRPSTAPGPRANSSDPFSDTQNKAAPETTRRTSGSATSSMRKASSTTNIVDDLSSIFGAAASSGEFQEVEGETDERRKARLERHIRIEERVVQALAEKNQRDLQAQREQAERHRIAETLDVEIKRWAAGKEGNLRALLSTMQYVLWPECGWQPVSLTDLITAAAVKRVYRRATLCIHPDKVQQKGANLQQKYIAEKVFDLLKEAWNKFNSEELF